jgi:hypothetical protein
VQSEDRTECTRTSPSRAKPLIDLRPDVGRDVNAIVMRCLAKSPKDHYADAGALLADLDRVQTLTAVQAAA